MWRATSHGTKFQVQFGQRQGQEHKFIECTKPQPNQMSSRVTIASCRLFRTKARYVVLNAHGVLQNRP
jgi:hypothetical protein